MPKLRQLVVALAVALVLGSAAHVVSRSRSAGKQDKEPVIAHVGSLGKKLTDALDSAVDVIQDLNAAPVWRHASEEPPQTSKDHVESAASGDAGWAALPRSDFALGAYLINLPYDIRAEVMVRHAGLNTNDVWVPPAEREMLDILLRRLGERFREFEGAQLQAALSDMLATAPSDYTEVPGAARVLTNADGTTTTRVRAVPPGLVEVHDGKAFVLRTPLFTSTLSHRAFLVEEAGAALLQWFCSRGLCARTDADALLGQIYQTAERTFRD